MIVHYYKWQIENVINQAKELPDGITEYEIVEVDENPDKTIEILQEISPAEFTYGLALQNVFEEEVLDFIENHISDADMKIKAKILFTKATTFEYNNPLLNGFISGFNQFLQAIGKAPIVFDDIFINGIKLNN